MTDSALWCDCCWQSTMDCECGLWDDYNTERASEAADALVSDVNTDEPVVWLKPICPACDDDNHVFCLECGEECVACECVFPVDWYCGSCGDDFQFDPSEGHLEDIEDLDLDAELVEENELGVLGCRCIPAKEYYCDKCGVTRSGDTGLWKRIPDNPSKIEAAGKTSKTYNPKSYGYSSSGSGSTYGGGYGYGSLWDDADYSYSGWSKDRHYDGDGLIMPTSGIKIYASSHDDKRKEGEFIPDWGLYLDWIWKPEWRHEHIHWPDMSVPSSDEAVVEAIIEAYERALDGAAVEVGCIGGHGRTGTVLACMAVIEGIDPESAITLVKTEYCKHAIETASQEWWIHWFGHVLFEHPLPAKPKASSYSYSGTSSTKPVGEGCTQADHYIYWMEGSDQCDNAKGQCRYWKADTGAFEEGRVSEYTKGVYDKWRAQKADKKNGTKSASSTASRRTVVVDGYRVPKPGRREKVHTPGAKRGCECDVCRYRAKGFGALLEPATVQPVDEHPDGEVVKVAQPSGGILEIRVADTFKPKPPVKGGSKLGEVRGEYMYTKEGWVWEGLAKAPAHLTKAKKKKRSKKGKKNGYVNSR